MCLENRVADRNPNISGLQPECSVTQHLDGVDSVVPMCGGPGDGIPCWRIIDDAECSATGQRIEIDRGGALPPEDGTIDLQCVVES
jgi:hypothetical protein